MKMYFKLVGLLSLGLMFFGACKPATPVPTATITSSVANNVVTFSLKTTNSSAYKWKFGDGDTAIVYSSAAIVHAYPKDGTTYSVSLLVLGPGGENTASTTVTIPTMTPMDKLTGGSSFTNGKAWRVSASYGITLAAPDSIMTLVENFPIGILTNIQLSLAYTDKYIFFSNGNYSINNLGGGALAGLTYCAAKGIPNVAPQLTDSLGLTYATPLTPPDNLTFSWNAGKNLTIAATSDGKATTNVTYRNVNTLSFSNGGYFGLLDYASECVVLLLAPTQMTVAYFSSDLPAQSPQIGKITSVLIVTLEVVP